MFRKRENIEKVRLAAAPAILVKFYDENVFEEEIMHEHYAGKRVARFLEWEEFLILELCCMLT